MSTADAAAKISLARSASSSARPRAHATHASGDGTRGQQAGDRETRRPARRRPSATTATRGRSRRCRARPSARTGRTSRPRTLSPGKISNPKSAETGRRERRAEVPPVADQPDRRRRPSPAAAAPHENREPTRRSHSNRRRVEPGCGPAATAPYDRGQHDEPENIARHLRGHQHPDREPERHGSSRSRRSLHARLQEQRVGRQERRRVEQVGRHQEAVAKQGRREHRDRAPRPPRESRLPRRVPDDAQDGAPGEQEGQQVREVDEQRVTERQDEPRGEHARAHRVEVRRRREAEGVRTERDVDRVGHVIVGRVGAGDAQRRRRRRAPTGRPAP